MTRYCTIQPMDARKRVLVVDDEPDILRVASTILGLAGYDVTTTTSGEEALLLAQSNKPDVMLLDLLMQPLTGFDVLDKLRVFSQAATDFFPPTRP
ncbi:MAG: response regulator [Chloroflexi bacterium]|nr:response regulator [Chloroflexota bacterium]